MYDVEWTELADQLCREYPTLSPEVIVRHVGVAAEAVALFGIGEGAVARAGTMVRNNLDEVAERKAEVDAAAEIAAQRSSPEDENLGDGGGLLRA
jgi:hypothetical protein